VIAPQGVQPYQVLPTIILNPEGGQGRRDIIQRRLGALLLHQGLRLSKVLYRQALSVSQVLDVRVVPYLVWLLEEGSSHVVNDAQGKEGCRDEGDGPVASDSLKSQVASHRSQVSTNGEGNESTRNK
jgi:hypothetical protein